MKETAERLPELAIAFGHEVRGFGVRCRLQDLYAAAHRIKVRTIQLLYLLQQ
ncbi:hypothetical protein D3C84_796310 [compost metagenome]